MSPFSLRQKQILRMYIDLIVQNPECVINILSKLPEFVAPYGDIQHLINLLLSGEVSKDPNLYMLQLLNLDIENVDIKWMLLDSVERRTEGLTKTFNNG